MESSASSWSCLNHLLNHPHPEPPSASVSSLVLSLVGRVLRICMVKNCMCGLLNYPKQEVIKSNVDLACIKYKTVILMKSPQGLNEGILSIDGISLIRIINSWIKKKRKSALTLIFVADPPPPPPFPHSRVFLSASFLPTPCVSKRSAFQDVKQVSKRPTITCCLLSLQQRTGFFHK